MPFISTKAKKEFNQSVVPSSYVEEASFSETFAASVGQTFDEDLSISSMLNLEGFNQRQQQVKELGDSGAFDINKYTSGVGDVDYNKLGQDFPEFKLKTDKELFEERRALLKQRRDYAQDVFERGNGMAQFLGMATAFMLDPINIATMPIATAGTAAKGLSAIGRAIQVGRNEAGLAVATELMIQPLVYQHKHAIDSPFEFTDALANIATAATGAFAIGSAVGGISGYLKAVREKTADLPLDDSAKMALESLARVEDDLNTIKASKSGEVVDLEQIEKDFILEVKEELTSSASSKITRGERKQINKELRDLESQLNNVKTDKVIPKKEKGLSARAAKRQAIESAETTANQEKLLIQEKIDRLQARLDIDLKASKAESDLSRIEQGIIPDVYKRRLDEIKSNDDLIKEDVEILTQLNNKQQEVNQPSKVPENYQEPKRQKATTGTITQRERAVIDRDGYTEDYDADIAAYKALENRRIIQDDEIVDADEFMKSIDDEI
ncbi:MAG: hypothetical protein GY905_02820, partial [Gammaproteobacteria bacterium]|nr:hypothetical protein [Gammaproteobacteria bacterium]